MKSMQKAYQILFFKIKTELPKKGNIILFENVSKIKTECREKRSLTFVQEINFRKILIVPQKDLLPKLTDMLSIVYYTWKWAKIDRHGS